MDVQTNHLTVDTSKNQNNVGRCMHFLVVAELLPSDTARFPFSPTKPMVHSGVHLFST